MTDARAEILARARSALADSPSVTYARETGTKARRRAQSPMATRALVDRFDERVSDYRASVLRTADDGVAAAVGEAMASWGGRRIVVPQEFPAAWLPDSSFSWQSDDPPLSNQELDALDGVVTLCAIGIAETGTVVLDGGGGQGRRALSLVPDRHVCIIRSQQIVADVPDAIDGLNPTRALTWISGPSATSDIELQRVEGVHGPRTLVVIIVEESIARTSPAEVPT